MITGFKLASFDLEEANGQLPPNCTGPEWADLFHIAVHCTNLQQLGRAGDSRVGSGIRAKLAVPYETFTT